MQGSLIHKLDGAKIIGLLEIMGVAKFCKPSSLNSTIKYIDPDNNVGCQQCHWVTLIFFNILVFRTRHSVYKNYNKFATLHQDIFYQLSSRLGVLDEING